MLIQGNRTGFGDLSDGSFVGGVALTAFVLGLGIIIASKTRVCETETQMGIRGLAISGL